MHSDTYTVNQISGLLREEESTDDQMSLSTPMGVDNLRVYHCPQGIL